MKDNPFVEILKAMPLSSDTCISIGVVLSSAPNLTIKVGDLQLDKDNLLIADYLMAAYEREIIIPESVATGLTDTTSAHTHTINKIGIASAKTKTKIGLIKGDMVALMPTADGQTFIVLARVVRS